MKPRKIREGVHWMGAIDWNRRLFDSLIPLPDGTSYNAYLVEGAEKVALIDTVDPPLLDVLKRHLANVPRVDYVIAHHAEQDHAGSIPYVLEKYPNAIVICSPKAKDLLLTHLDVPENKIKTVEDGETLALGGKTLTFIHTPWVATCWPVSMVLRDGMHTTFCGCARSNVMPCLLKASIVGVRAIIPPLQPSAS